MESAMTVVDPPELTSQVVPLKPATSSDSTDGEVGIVATCLSQEKTAGGGKSIEVFRYHLLT
jgi:hypothetical protein